MGEERERGEGREGRGYFNFLFCTVHRMSRSWEEAQESLAKEKNFLFTSRKRILLFPGLVRSPPLF